MRDALASSKAKFPARLGDQQDAATARGRAADMRIRAGNAFYEEPIELCALSKDLYATTDARKYAHYVVTTPGPPQTQRPGGRKRNRAPRGVLCCGFGGTVAAGTLQLVT
ncbi:hypothetical protein [Hymenobacter ruber]